MPLAARTVSDAEVEWTCGPFLPHPARPACSARRRPRPPALTARPPATSGYCFVANQAGRSVAVVDLSRFTVRGADRSRCRSGRRDSASQPGRRSSCWRRRPARSTRSMPRRSPSAAGPAPAARPWARSLRRGGDALWVLYREPAALVEFPLESLQPGAPHPPRRRRRIAST